MKASHSVMNSCFQGLHCCVCSSSVSGLNQLWQIKETKLQRCRWLYQTFPYPWFNNQTIKWIIIIGNYRHYPLVTSSNHFGLGKGSWHPVETSHSGQSFIFLSLALVYIVKWFVPLWKKWRGTFISSDYCIFTFWTICIWTVILLDRNTQIYGNPTTVKLTAAISAGFWHLLSCAIAFPQCNERMRMACVPEE